MNKTEEQIVCASCGRVMGASGSYCPHCLAPSIGGSNLDPMQAIHSEGHAISKAAEGKQKPIVLVGIWILFFPLLVGSLLVAANSFRQGYASDISGLLFVGGSIALALISGIILYRVTKNYFSHSAEKKAK